MWRITDSNRWPPACKAGALASWANPPFLFAHILALFAYVVPGRVELPTSTLSVWRSNQLSYRTVSQINRANGDLHRNFMELILTHLPIALPIYIVTSQHEIQVVKLLTNLFKTFVKTRFFYFSNRTISLFIATRASAPERRCSSRTFRYGYLVTT